jgi:hypothetical protein
MLTWIIEHGGRSVPLEQVTAPAIRSVIDPIRANLARSLDRAEGIETLAVIFVVDDDGGVMIQLRGDPLAVNTARDILGDRHRIGPRLS